MNDVAGAIDAEELKSVMTMVPGAGEIEAMIAAVDHEDDQTADNEEFELKMIEQTADVSQTLPSNGQCPCRKSPHKQLLNHIQSLSCRQSSSASDETR